MIGKTLAHYEITGLLGKGGVNEGRLTVGDGMAHDRIAVRGPRWCRVYPRGDGAYPPRAWPWEMAWSPPFST